MDKKIYRVVVIGTGMIANAAHIPAWRDLKDDVELVGVADIRPSAAQETAARYQIPRWYNDPQAMLDELKPDIVSVCTPNVYHKQWTIAALKSGANVLCEKPIATSLADAQEMYATAKTVGRALYACQSLRFMNSFSAAREFVASGELGDIYYCEINAIRRRGVPKWGFFHMAEHNAGGPLCDLGVHILDFLFWTIGNPNVVAASASTYTKLSNIDEGLITSLADSGAPLGVFTPRAYDYHEFDVEDFAAGFLRLENGACVVIKTSWAINLPENFMISIAGTRGGLQLPPVKLLKNQGRYLTEVLPKVLPDRDVAFSGHYGLTTNFIKFLRGEEEMLVKQTEALNVVRAIESLYRSAKEGREVQANEIGHQHDITDQTKIHEHE
jgi:predicted dehydrogenase